MLQLFFQGSGTLINLYIKSLVSCFEHLVFAHNKVSVSYIKGARVFFLNFKEEYKQRVISATSCVYLLRIFLI